MPYAVQEVYPALLAGGIHCAGGITGLERNEVVATDRHSRFDPGSDAWRALAALPAPRHHLQMAAEGDRLYALGGFATVAGTGSWVMQAQTWAYSVAAGAWSALHPAPEPHAESVCATLGGRIHLCAGRRPRGTRNAAIGDHRDSRRHLVYEPDSDRWSQAAPPTTARNSAAAAVIDGLWYVVGGRRVTSGNVDTTEVYDPIADRWHKLAPMPRAQAGLAAAAVAGRLYVFGGEFRAADGAGVFPEAWQYDPRADRWAPVAPLPTARHGLGAVASGGEVVVLGGATGVGAVGTTAAVEVFTPAM